MEDKGECLVLYDGVCGLCNTSVQFLLKRDNKDRLRFASLQSETAKHLLETFGVEEIDLNSIYVVTQPNGASSKVLRKGRAIANALYTLGGGWRGVILSRILPGFIIDACYDFVAKRRYKWFGKLESCPLPNPKWSWKFLDQ